MRIFTRFTLPAIAISLVLISCAEKSSDSDQENLFSTSRGNTNKSAENDRKSAFSETVQTDQNNLNKSGKKPVDLILDGDITASAYLYTSNGMNTKHTMDLLDSDRFPTLIDRLQNELPRTVKASEDHSLLQQSIQATLKNSSLKTGQIQSSCNDNLCMIAFDTDAKNSEIATWTQNFSTTTNGLGNTLFQTITILPNGQNQLRLIVSTNLNTGGVSIPTNNVPITIKTIP